MKIIIYAIKLQWHAIIIIILLKDKLTQCVSYEKCVELQFKYIKGKECTNKCEENDYKIEAILNNEGKAQTIGACFSDKNDCIKEGNIFFT